MTARPQVELPELRSAFHVFVKSQGGSVVQREGEYIESMTRLWWTCWRAAIAESEARAMADKDAVDELLCRCIGLARKINDDVTGDEYLNASADLLRMLERAKSPRTGIALFRAPRWKDAAIAKEAGREADSA